MLDFGFDGRRAMVVGSGPGMGGSVARILAEGGAQVACVDLNSEQSERIAAELVGDGHRAIAVSANVCDPAAVSRVMDEVVSAYGGVDICIDIVGAVDWGTVIETTDQTWDRMLDACLRQAFLISRAVGRQMSEQGTGGALAFVTSVSGLTASPFHGAYGAAKAGLQSLVQTLAVELGPAGIRANAVAPGTIATPEAMASQKPEYRAALAEAVPLGRQGTADDIAAALAFLVSDLAGFVTGQTLIVDGGAMVMHSLPVKPAPRPEGFRHATSAT